MELTEIFMTRTALKSTPMLEINSIIEILTKMEHGRTHGTLNLIRAIHLDTDQKKTTLKN